MTQFWVESEVVAANLAEVHYKCNFCEKTLIVGERCTIIGYDDNDDEMQIMRLHPTCRQDLICLLKGEK